MPRRRHPRLPRNDPVDLPASRIGGVGQKRPAPLSRMRNLGGATYLAGEWAKPLPARFKPRLRCHPEAGSGGYLSAGQPAGLGSTLPCYMDPS